jgi:DNA-binding XRE family transcriptional regulator
MTAHERLAVWRERAGITQTAAAAKLGVSTATWCDWENDKKIPRVDMALRLERMTHGKVRVAHWGEAATKRREIKRQLDSEDS